jgi:hypothetical protein
MPNPAAVPGTHLTPQQQLQQQQANQGAIETKMSLPRPAAVAQWLMEQGEVEIHGPRSTGVIIAIAALATLCVMGVASLIVYKLRLPPQSDPFAIAAPVVDTPTELDPAESPDALSSKEQKSGAKDTKGAKTGAKADTPAAGGTKKEDEKAKPGRLTINCHPACDSIVASGQSLGPSPVFSHEMPPGQHTVTCKGNGVTKKVVLVIRSGELTSQTVPMQ